MATFGTRVLTDPVSQWFTNKPLSLVAPSVPSTTIATLTADPAAHTFGAWVELIASLPADTSMLSIYVSGIRANGTDTASVVSLGFGGSGSETEFVYFATGGVGEAGVTYTTGVFLQLPIALLSGTRIAARFQSRLTTSPTARINVASFSADPTTFPTINKTVDSLGVTLATSLGTDIATANTYSEVVSSTSQPYRGVVIVPSTAAANIPGAQGSMTVAVGPSSSESDIGSIFINSFSGEMITAGPSFFIPHFIPAGSRLSVKQSIASTVYDVTLLGIPF